MLLAVSVVPLATITGSTETAVRTVGFAAIVYLTVHLVVLIRRQRLESDRDLPGLGGPRHPAPARGLPRGAGDRGIGQIGWLEALLVTMLARPMTAFLFVLSMFGTRRADGQ